jgi:hypothetical protein
MWESESGETYNEKIKIEQLIEILFWGHFKIILKFTSLLIEIMKLYQFFDCITPDSHILI